MKTVLNKNIVRAFLRGFAWALVIIVVPLVASTGFIPVLAQADAGTIAYVRTTSTTGDEIRLIEPDSSNDRQLWKTGISDAGGLAQIFSLAWNPAASDLAFASRHEEACSFYNSDIYAIHANGSGYRRITAGPACGQTAGLPTGTVMLPIQNWTDTAGPFVVYFQGAPRPQTITLAPGSQTTVTFTGVADYGNFKQWGVAVFGEYRFFAVTGDADVLPGKTVTAGTIAMYESYTNWGWSWPTWTSDGNGVAYIFNGQTPYGNEVKNTQPGMIGSLIFNVPIGSYPYDPAYFSWAPPGPRANQVLYSAWDQSYSDSWIYLGTAGSNSPGEALFSTGDGEGHAVLGLAWLPDSSGFLFTQTVGWNDYANIFEYNFATQVITQLTDLTSGYPRQLSISPDGTQVVYEFQATGAWTDLNIDLDLWMMDLDTGESSLFVENGRAPAWSPQAISDPRPVPPVVGNQKVFLPAVIRP